jgi:hypothetical protein
MPKEKTMTMKTALTGASGAWALARTNKFMPQINFESEDGTGNPDAAAEAAKAAAAEAAKVAADKVAADAAAAAKAEADRKASGLSDKEADLLKENMAKKEKLKEADAKLAALQAEIDKFKDIDPEKAKALMAKEAEAEKASLEAKGEFDRLKKMMAEEHAKEKDALTSAQKATETALAGALSQINELTIGQAFSNSEFVKSELVMPAGKVRSVYGAHFEMEAGRIVAFDKPKGTESRSKLVDGSGEPMSFEVAMRKIIEADSDRDSLLKSKLKEGAGSNTSNDDRNKGGTGDTGLKGLSRIAAGLNERTKK